MIWIRKPDAIEKAVEKVLKEGYRTIDIMSEGKTQIGTAGMGDLIASSLGGKNMRSDYSYKRKTAGAPPFFV